MSKQFEQAYKDYCEGKVDAPTELLRVIWEENKEAIEAFIAKGGFYTKQQRTWVNATEWRGLTDEELELLNDCGDTDSYKFARAIEAKLKEKNT